MTVPRYKIAIVNYLNTLPFITGLIASSIFDDIELIETSPARCASLFLEKSVDISLVPVGALLGHDYHRISNFGISSIGPVSSVCIFSAVPIQEVTSVLLDYQSRTSNLLGQILFERYWKLSPEFISSTIGYESKINGTTAGLVIGDRALELKSSFTFVYDLGQIWQEYSQLPFTYAIWCSTHILPDGFIMAFEEALKLGISKIPQIVKELALSYPSDLETYYSKNIRYVLSSKHDMGIEKFLNDAMVLGLSKVGPIPLSIPFD